MTGTGDECLGVLLVPVDEPLPPPLEVPELLPLPVVLPEPRPLPLLVPMVKPPTDVGSKLLLLG